MLDPTMLSAPLSAGGATSAGGGDAEGPATPSVFGALLRALLPHAPNNTLLRDASTGTEAVASARSGPAPAAAGLPPVLHGSTGARRPVSSDRNDADPSLALALPEQAPAVLPGDVALPLHGRASPPAGQADPAAVAMAPAASAVGRLDAGPDAGPIDDRVGSADRSPLHRSAFTAPVAPPLALSVARPDAGDPGRSDAFAGAGADAPGSGRVAPPAVLALPSEARSAGAAPAPLAPDGQQAAGLRPVLQGGPSLVPTPPVEVRAALADAASPAAIDAGATPEVVPEASVDLAGPMRSFDRAQTTPSPVAGDAPRTALGAPTAQVEVHLARAAQGRIDRLVVQLEPADLGRVEIRLEFGAEGRVGAIISAERPETLEALQRDAAALERSLRDAGLRPDAGGLSFGLQRDQQDKGGQAAGRPSRPRAAADRDGSGSATGVPERWTGRLRLLDIHA